MKKWRHHIFLALFCLGFTHNPIAANTFSTIATGLITFSSLVCGQELTSFGKSFGGAGVERAHGSFQLSGDRTIVVGETDTDGAGEFDALINVYNTTSGALLSTQTLGGLGNETAYDVEDTHDGGYALLGFTDGTGAGGKDIMYVKIGSDNLIAWAWAIGGTGDDIGTSLKRTSDNGFVITANSDSFSTYDDAMVIKTDSGGVITWNTATTGIYNDRLYDIGIDTNGDYIGVGSTQSYAIENSDAFLLGINATGHLNYAKGFFDFDEAFYGIAMAGDDSFGTAGYSFAMDTGWVELFMVFDPTATLSKAVSYGIGNIDYSNGIVKTSIGYVVTGGSPQEGALNYDLSITEFDDNGEVEWFKSFGGNTDENKGTSVTLDGNNDLIVAAIKGANNGAGDMNLGIYKFLGSGLADCASTWNPAVFDVTFDFEEHVITPTMSSPSLTVTDITSYLTLATIASPVEGTDCSQSV